VNSFDIIKWLVTENELETCEFFLYTHKAQKNWRQINNTFNKKIENIDTGVKFDTYDLTNISGGRLLDLENLNDYTASTNPLVSFASKFRKEDDIFHIPMMNLHICDKIERNKLTCVLDSIIGKRFWLLETDRYYHIYSNNILNNEEWIKWNMKFLMTDCLVSARYIGHSIERGFNLLRQNATCVMKIKIPTVVYDSELKSYE